MTRPIQVLTEEHERIRSMLSCFGGQLERIRHAKEPDYEILEGSLSYCKDYLDSWHHPREDALLKLLEKRAPAAAENCKDLEQQHLELARMTRELVQILESIEQGTVYLRGRLVEMGQLLVNEYRRHIDWEESDFFPAVAHNLVPEDWRDIASHFADAADPLVENPVDQRYRALFNAINEA